MTNPNDIFFKQGDASLIIFNNLFDLTNMKCSYKDESVCLMGVLPYNKVVILKDKFSASTDLILSVLKSQIIGLNIFKYWSTS